MSMRAAVSAALAVLAVLAFAGPARAAVDRSTVLVSFASGTPAEQTALIRSAGGIGTVARIDAIGVQVVQVAGGRPDLSAKVLAASPLVDFAETNPILSTSAIPNDPRFGELYGMDRIDAPEGWDAAGVGTFPSTGGVKVGIVDTGIRAGHEDLSGKVVDCAGRSTTLLLFSGGIREGNCVDDNGHGTHVAGTIAAIADNGRGVAGVGFDSPLSICKALGGPTGNGSTADVAGCITYLADKGARVISMSLGGGASTTMQRAVNYADGKGALLIAAAGNDGDSRLNYPAAYPNVMSVAATDSADRRASFSNANADVEIAAPGVGILSTWHTSNSSYRTLSGTSMATPHVSGAAALILSHGGASTAAQARSRLQAAVDDLGPAGRDPSYGFGRLDLPKAFP